MRARKNTNPDTPINLGSMALTSEAATQTYAFIGMRGTGKTTGCGVLVEEMLTLGVQCVIVDPTDAWWGLKSSRSGESNGFPVIVFGGNHADIPLIEGSGKALAEFIVESGQSVIICTRRLGSKAKARHLVGDLFHHLYRLKGEPDKNAPLFCVFDECHNFVPQFVTNDSAVCVGAVTDCVTEGRNVGFGIALISQRAAKVNKDVLSQCEVLVAFHVSGKHDRKAIREWVEENAETDKCDELITNLTKAQRGEAWLWSPSWLQLLQPVKFRSKTTFDSSYTPKVGEVRVVPKKLAPIDLAVVEAKMRSVTEKIKSEDPQVLLRRIADLQSQLRAKPQDAPTKAPVAAASVLQAPSRQLLSRLAAVRKLLVVAQTCGPLILTEEALKEFAENAVSSLVRAVAPNLVAARKVSENGRAKISEALTALDAATATGPVAVTGDTGPVAVTGDTVVIANGTRAEVATSVTVGNDESSVGGGLQRMLTALAQKSPLTRKQLAVRAGMSSNSGTYSAYLSTGRTSGYIKDDKDGMSITPSGLTALGSYEPLPRGKALLDYWCKYLGPNSGMARILKVAYAHAPHVLSREELSVRAECSSNSGTFSAYLSKLRTLELLNGTEPCEEFFN